MTPTSSMPSSRSSDDGQVPDPGRRRLVRPQTQRRVLDKRGSDRDGVVRRALPGLHRRRRHDVVVDGWLQPEQLASSAEFAVWFGTDQQGCDVYALTVFGARPSVTVGTLAALFTTLLGAVVGLTAGFYGAALDAVLSRIVDIFFGLPFILGAIIILTAITLPGIWGVLLALTLLGWVTAARMVRAKTIEAKGQDYTLAARALGAEQRQDSAAAHPSQCDRTQHRRRGDLAGHLHRR